MKKLVLTTLLIMTVGAMLFAQGTREPAGVWDYTGRFTSEEVTLSGTLEAVGDEIAIVTADGSYTLSAQGSQYLDLDSYEGVDVTVYGKIIDECPEGFEGHVFVEIAEAGGEQIAFNSMGRWNSEDSMRDSSMIGQGSPDWDADDDRMGTRGSARGMRGQGQRTDL